MTAIVTGTPEAIARVVIALKYMPVKVTVRPPHVKVTVSADGRFRIGDWAVYDSPGHEAQQIAHITQQGMNLQAYGRWPIGHLSHVRPATAAEIAEAQIPKPNYWDRFCYPDGWPFHGDHT